MGYEKTTSDNLQASAKTLKIGDLSAVTGVLTVTLRAWENRYGLLKPRRTAKGHRLYSSEDVLRVRQILAWIDMGVSLANIKRLQEGVELEAEHPRQAKLIALAQGLRQRALRQQMDALFKEQPLAKLLDELWPLSVRWPDSALTASSRALFCQELERQLSRYHWQRKPPKKKLIIAGAMPGLYRHCITALLSTHYQVLDLCDEVEAREVQLAAQVLDGVPVICGDLAQRKGDWFYVTPSMKFSELERELL